MGNGAPPSTQEDFVCPNCGNFVDELNTRTGWCYECSPIITALSTVEVALSANADAIEFYIIQGRMNGKVLAGEVWEALRLAQSDRPTCIVCGERITRAKRNAIFCRRTKECRRYSRRYVYLYRERGFTKVEALASIFTELTGD